MKSIVANGNDWYCFDCGRRKWLFAANNQKFDFSSQWMYPRKIGTGDNVYFAHMCYYICQEMFYLNTIEQLIHFVEQIDQLEVCLPYSRILTGILILVVFQNLRRYSNKISLICFLVHNVRVKMNISSSIYALILLSPRLN